MVPTDAQVQSAEVENDKALAEGKTTGDKSALQDQYEEATNSYEAINSVSQDLAEVEHSGHSKKCHILKKCANKHCPRRLCGSHKKRFCDIFVGCLCNRKICRDRYKKECHSPCRLLIKCYTRACGFRCHGKKCHFLKKLCLCKKKVCLYKFKAICKKYPRKLELNSVDNVVDEQMEEEEEANENDLQYEANGSDESYLQNGGDSSEEYDFPYEGDNNK